MKTFFLLLLTFLALLSSKSTISRSTPAIWESFISSSELIVDGKVIKAEYGQSRFDEVESVKLWLQVSEIYTSNEQYSSLKTIEVITDWSVNQAEVGARGLFFLRKKDEVFYIFDPDVGYWEEQFRLIQDGASQFCDLDKFDRARVYNVPMLYLAGIPDEYWEPGYFADYTCANVEKGTPLGVFKKQIILKAENVKPQLKSIF
ncbi:hypothetical protein [Kangiella geojedonensis]|uniref:Uncharacterized protein n=1 Tax=Kangiella geojedonensis TaxID=914150 RepID=A0A0F6RCE3_9GAMM|nr:hypothetical protein [Kangiella geojedonensis]AKE51981.1 hypothetical protein TQ33_1018 [Kangiella geojedonensis]